MCGFIFSWLQVYIYGIWNPSSISTGSKIVCSFAWRSETGTRLFQGLDILLDIILSRGRSVDSRQALFCRELTAFHHIDVEVRRQRKTRACWHKYESPAGAIYRTHANDVCELGTSASYSRHISPQPRSHILTEGLAPLLRSAT